MKSLGKSCRHVSTFQIHCRGSHDQLQSLSIINIDSLINNYDGSLGLRSSKQNFFMGALRVSDEKESLSQAAKYLIMHPKIQSHRGREFMVPS